LNIQEEGENSSNDDSSQNLESYTFNNSPSSVKKFSKDYEVLLGVI